MDILNNIEVIDNLLSLLNYTQLHQYSNINKSYYKMSYEKIRNYNFDMMLNELTSIDTIDYTYKCKKNIKLIDTGCSFMYVRDNIATVRTRPGRNDIPKFLNLNNLTVDDFIIDVIQYNILIIRNLSIKKYDNINIEHNFYGYKIIDIQNLDFRIYKYGYISVTIPFEKQKDFINAFKELRVYIKNL
jgi:hypothetical protein